MTILRLALLAATAVLFAGCGHHDTNRVDTSNPEAVARAYYTTFYRCASTDPGLRYDLSTSPQRDWPRSKYERMDRCRPAPLPPVDALLVDRHREQAIVVIRGQHIQLPLILVQLDNGEWRVDTSQSETPVRMTTS